MIRAFAVLPLLLAPLLAAAAVVSENLQEAANGASASLLFSSTSSRGLGDNLERNLQNGEYIDFTELLDPGYNSDAASDDTDSFLGLLSDGLEWLKDYVHTRDDKGNLKINELIRGLLDDDGFIEFEIEGGYFLDLGSGSSVNLTNVGVKGLDTMLEADLLQPTMVSMMDENATDAETDGTKKYDSLPETTLQNTFFLETLVLDLYLLETTKQGEEKIKVRLPFAGVNVLAMPLILAIFEEGIKNFPMGAALDHTNRLMPCLSEMVVDDALIVALEATFEEVGTPTMMEDSNPATESPFLDVAITLFGFPIAVPIFFNSTIRGLLNDVLNNNLLEPDIEIEDPCPSYPTSKDLDKDQKFIDFPSFFDAGLPAMLMTLVEEEIIAISPETGLSKINNVLIEPLMEEMGELTIDVESGRTSMLFGSGEEPLMDVSTNLDIGGLSAEITLRLSDVTIYNLDTMIPPLEVLQPVPEEAQLLNNTITMGLDMEENPERSMGLSANVFLSLVTDGDGSIEHDLRLEANMEDLSLVLSALLEIVESKLYGFPVKDILNLQCWLAALNVPEINDRTGIRLESDSPTAGIAELKASMEKMNMGLACNGGDCTSVGMEEWIGIMETPDAQAEITEFMNSVLLPYVAGLLSGGGAILQTPIDRLLNEAPMQCPHDPSYDPEAEIPVSYEDMDAVSEPEYNYEYLILWGSFALALIAVFVAVAIGVRCNARGKHKLWLANADSSSKKKTFIFEQQREKYVLEEALNASTQSMFYSPEIPALIRWSMPVIILGNVALFLSGHLNLGATVFIEANIAGDTIRVGDFFDFAIARTTIDLWKNGGKALALLILCFSGIWPYTKQFLTLALWFLPTSKMSISTRGTYFMWLDKLAKWSMIDIFVIVLCIAAFRVKIISPELAFLPEDFYSVDLMIVPMWGLYSNMTAQLVSQVSSHFIIYYHRSIVSKATEKLAGTTEGEQATKPKTEGKARKIVLNKHSFSNPYYESSEMLVAKKWVGASILVSCLCMSGLIILGSFVPSFSVELLGIIGVAVESGQDFEEAITQHSVWSIVNMTFEVAQFLNTLGGYIGIGVLGGLFVATIMVIPILQSLFLLCQWFAPLGQTARRRLSVLNEILQAWQYVEVYLISIFVASWQFGPVSQYMFNAYCGSLDGFFAQMVSYGILKEADGQCFSVQGFIDPGSIALLVAAILLALVNSVVTLASKQCLEDRGGVPAFENEAHQTASEPSSEEESSAVENKHPVEETAAAKTADKIRPLPFVFTDIHRWLLIVPTESKEDNDDV